MHAYCFLAAAAAAEAAAAAATAPESGCAGAMDGRGGAIDISGWMGGVLAGTGAALTVAATGFSAVTAAGIG